MFRLLWDLLHPSEHPELANLRRIREQSERDYQRAEEQRQKTAAHNAKLARVVRQALSK